MCESLLGKFILHTAMKNEKVDNAIETKEERG